MNLLMFHGVGPPVVWRTTRGCLMLAILCAVLACGLTAWRYTLADRRRPWQRYTIMTFGFLPALVIFPLGALRLRGVTRAWQRTGGRLCTHCAYDITGLTDRGTCPECGRGYDVEADAARWGEVGLVRLMPPGEMVSTRPDLRTESRTPHGS
jgi:hypothetical protein